jgi:hypothetical protein
MNTAIITYYFYDLNLDHNQKLAKFSYLHLQRHKKSYKARRPQIGKQRQTQYVATETQ